jgi:transcriptional regulator with XRE-family HTH domain
VPRSLLSTTTPAAQLGCTIRDARAQLGLRQRDLAREVGIGIATLRRIECGGLSGPNVFVILRLFEALELPLARLHGIDVAERR